MIFQGFAKNYQKIQGSLKYEKYNWFFSRIPMYIYYNISRNFLERVIFQKALQICIVNQKPHLTFNKFFPKIMWEIWYGPHRTLMTIWRMRTACWISKATNAHSDNVTLHDFHGKNDCPNAPQRYVTCTLPVLFWYRSLACLLSTLLITQQCAHLVRRVYNRVGNGMEINAEKNK